MLAAGPQIQHEQQQILDFFEEIRHGNSLAALLRYFQARPELLHCHHPVTKLRPLDYASALGRTNIVEFLLLGANPNTPNKQDKNKYPILYAAQNGHTMTVKLLVENGADPYAIDKQAKGILAYAKESANIECIGACRDKKKLLPLTCATCAKNICKAETQRFIRILMLKQQKPQTNTRASVTVDEQAIVLALQDADKPEPLHYLSNLNPALLTNSPSGTMLRPIDIAASFDYFHTVHYLISLKVDPNSTNVKDNNKVPLHYAAKHGNLNTLKLLLAYCATPYALDSQNHGLLYYAIESGNEACINYCADKNKLRAHFLLNQLMLNTEETKEKYYVEALALQDHIYAALVERINYLPDHEAQQLLRHAVHVGEDKKPDTLFSQLMHNGSSDQIVHKLKQLIQDQSEKDTKQFHSYPPYIPPDIWAKIIPYVGPHTSSLARTSRFFDTVTSNCRKAKMQQKFTALGPFATAHAWKNPEFILAVFTRVRSIHSGFREHFPSDILFLLYSRNDILVWCVLDDNVELFQRDNQLSIADHRNYLTLAIAFGRSNIISYLLKFHCTNSTQELNLLFKLALFSGLNTMVDLVLNLNDQETLEQRELPLAASCLHATIPIPSALCDLKIEDHNALLNIKRFSEAYTDNFYAAIDSGNSAMIDRMLKLYPGYTITQFMLGRAARLGCVAIFNKFLQMNKNLVIDQYIFRKGIASGNLMLVNRILFLNNKLKIMDEELGAAMRSGNVKMFEKIHTYYNLKYKSLVLDVLDPRKVTNFLNDAVSSGNPDMVDKVMLYVRRPYIDTLEMAVNSVNPEMINKVLVLGPPYTSKEKLLRWAALTFNPHMVNRVLQYFPELINDEEIFTNDVGCSLMVEYLKRLKLSQQNQECSNESASSMKPGGRNN